MSNLEIRVQRVVPLYDKYACPTIRFVGEITNRADDRVFLAYLQCEITLKDKRITLGTVPIAVANLPQNQTKNLKF